jgi:hypothetical protein
MGHPRQPNACGSKSSKTEDAGTDSDSRLPDLIINQLHIFSRTEASVKSDPRLDFMINSTRGFDSIRNPFIINDLHDCTGGVQETSSFSNPLLIGSSASKNGRLFFGPAELLPPDAYTIAAAIPLDCFHSCSCGRLRRTTGEARPLKPVRQSKARQRKRD